MVSMGAKVITVDPRPLPDKVEDTGLNLNLPDICMLFDTNVATGKCFCGRVSDYSGYHRLNCSRQAGRSWAQGHNLWCQVAALGFENRRLGLSVVDIDTAIRRQFTHLN